MKRTRLWAFWLVTSLLWLTGCSGTTAASTEAVASQALPVESVEVLESGGYLVPGAWQELSINDGTLGYITSASQLPSGSPIGSVIESSHQDEDGTVVLTQYDLDGNVLHTVSVTPLSEMAGAQQSITHYRFGDDVLWLVRYCFEMLDEENGDYLSCSYLEQWSYDNALLFSATLDNYGIDEMENYLTDMELGPTGGPILASASAVVFLDVSGQEAGRFETGGLWLSLCRDGSGRVYLVDDLETNSLYTLNEDSFSLGDPILELDGNSRVLPGGGDYDLFLSSDTTLKGVSFENGTITEILSWADWGLAGSVTGLTILDSGDFLLRVAKLVSGSNALLTMTAVPASEIPEKSTLHLAMPLSQDYINMGLSWTDSLDQKIMEMISQFNQENDEYELEVVTFSSATELNLMLASGDAPDLICNSYNSWLEEPVSSTLLAKKGYLEDLEPYFDADEELSLPQLMPNVVEMERARNGGIYALPLGIYATGMAVSTDYVGDEESWSLSDLLEAARQLPEDMEVWSYMYQSEALDTLFGASYQQFLDMNEGACDFQNQEFYDLLTLCRDYFQPFDENAVESPGGGLITGFSTMGRLGQFYTDTIRPLEAQGKVLLSYPSSSGSGLNVIFMDQLAICSQSQHKDAAWQFLRTLYSYDFQYSYSSIFVSLRQDVMNDREDSYQQMYSEDLTAEESQYVRDLVASSTNYREISNPILSIVAEEAEAFFAGDKTAQNVAEIIENRVKIYLSEQS